MHVDILKLINQETFYWCDAKCILAKFDDEWCRWLRTTRGLLHCKHIGDTNLSIAISLHTYSKYSISTAPLVALFPFCFSQSICVVFSPLSGIRDTRHTTSQDATMYADTLIIAMNLTGRAAISKKTLKFTNDQREFEDHRSHFVANSLDIGRPAHFELYCICKRSG